MKVLRPKILSLASQLAALPLLLGILQCGPGTAIEQQSLDTGEGIILKFDGPFTYEYKVKGNPVAKSYTSSSEEQILLKNHYSDSDPQDTLDETLIGYAGITYDNKVSIFLGPDMKIKNSAGSTVVPDGYDVVYKEKAYITNEKKPQDGALNLDTPIEFSKNLIGITTVRKEKICVDGSGNPVPSHNNTKVPNLNCPPFANMKDTGNILQFDYPADKLKELLGTSGERKNSFLYVWHKGDPLTLTLQNTKEIKIALSPGVLGAFKQTPTFQFDPSIAGNLIPGPGSGNTPANPENPSQGGEDPKDSVPIDSKVTSGATGPTAPEGGAITTAAAASEGGKGCSLGTGPDRRAQGWAEWFVLAVLAASAWALRRQAH